MNRIVSFISLSFFVLINIIFSYKYLIRISNDALLLSILYGLCLYIIFYFINKIPEQVSYKKYIYLFLILIVTIQGVLHFKIPVETLNTDRWSVITSFLDELFSGNFPYLAKSHLNNPPGPFPGYYLFALPFYSIGQIGLFSLAGLIIFLSFLKFEKIGEKSIFIILVLLISSIVVWYELIVRSTIFANMAIALFYFFLLNKSNNNSFKSLTYLGLLGGLVLSTRGIMVYVLIVYFTYIFISHKEWYKLSIVSIFTTIGFLFTLIPFIVWDWQLFMNYNPITLQASFIPKMYLILFVIVAFGIGYKSKNVKILMGNIGLLLFAIVSIPFFIKVYNSSLYIAIVENGFDISYFLFSIPFLVYTFHYNEQNLLSKVK